MNLHNDLLVADFQQCFEQIRHYDETFRRTLEFAVAGLLAILGLSAGLLAQYGPTPLITASIGVLMALASLASFFLFVSLGRNRVYFAFVARYVNEIRSLYLTQAPGGLENKAGIYHDPQFPKIYNPWSSHTIQLYFLSSGNAFVFALSAVALFAVLPEGNCYQPHLNWTVGLLAFFLFLSVQVVWLLSYWFFKEKVRTADAAVFGKKA